MVAYALPASEHLRCFSCVVSGAIFCQVSAALNHKLFIAWWALLGREKKAASCTNSSWAGMIWIVTINHNSKSRWNKTSFDDGCSVLSLRRGCTLFFCLEKFLEHQSKYNVLYNIRLLPADARLIIVLWSFLHKCSHFCVVGIFLLPVCVPVEVFFSPGHMVCACFGPAPYTNL